MTSNTTWANRQRRTGWILAATGGLVCGAGLTLQALSPALPFDPRVVTALGIFLLGLSGASLVRGGVGSRSSHATQRLEVEERDERNVAIRRLAGSHAYLASAALSYAVLMWVSISANGQLPSLSPDGLWWALAAAVVVPGLVYVLSLLQAERSM